MAQDVSATMESKKVLQLHVEMIDIMVSQGTTAFLKNLAAKFKHEARTSSLTALVKNK